VVKEECPARLENPGSLTKKALHVKLVCVWIAFLQPPCNPILFAKIKGRVEKNNIGDLGPQGSGKYQRVCTSQETLPLNCDGFNGRTWKKQIRFS
jgi:hypothetical protein